MGGGVFAQIVLVSSAPITNSAVGLQGGCLNKLVFNARAGNWHSQTVMTVMTVANCYYAALSLWGEGGGLYKCFAINVWVNKNSDLTMNG